MTQLHWNIENKSRGCGDTIAKIVAIVQKITKQHTECHGCKKRQEFLNKILPYKKK